MTTSATSQISVEKTLSKAKIAMMQIKDTVFFSTLCISLETIITKDVPTAATDGHKLYINPDFFMALSQKEQVFLLAHETLHVAYMHALRKGDKDPQIFNMAADYVINAELKQRGFTFIEGGLYDRKFVGMSTEAVYAELIKSKEKLPSMDGLTDLDYTAGNSKANPASGADLEAKEHEVLAKISRAAMSAQMANQAGSIPGDIARALEKLSKPRVNWKSVLQRFLAARTSNDYSWRRPNRKYMPNYLPKLNSEALGRIDFAIDTSGSVSVEDFTQFVSEIHGVLRMFNPQTIGVYQFDHALQGNHTVRNIRDLIKLPFRGGGGTNPQCAIEEYTKHDGMALIILTDGCFRTRYLVDPKKPVIWIIYDNEGFVPPFGKAIHIREQTT